MGETVLRGIKRPSGETVEVSLGGVGGGGVDVISYEFAFDTPNLAYPGGGGVPIYTPRKGQFISGSIYWQLQIIEPFDCDTSRIYPYIWSEGQDGFNDYFMNFSWQDGLDEQHGGLMRVYATASGFDAYVVEDGIPLLLALIDQSSPASPPSPPMTRGRGIVKGLIFG